MIANESKWLDVQPDGIPAELKALPQFVLWAFEPRRQGDDPTKIPYEPDGRRWAKANDATTWGRFQDALDTYRRRRGKFAGIGFEFAPGGGVVGIDVDDCRDKDTGHIAPWAVDVIERFGSYSEVSPSGTGVKIWARGAIPCDGTGRKRPYHDGAVEMYGHGRYFAVTGHRLESAPITVNEAQGAIDWLWATAGFAEPKRPERNGHHQAAHDDRIVERARKYVAKMEPAVSGQGGSDRAMDAACVLVLGFGFTPEQAYPLFIKYNERCVPAWNEAEIWHKLRDADKKPGERGYLRDAQRNGHHPSSNGHVALRSHDATGPDLPSIETLDGRTDVANARRLAMLHGDKIRWCDPWGKWLFWDSRRWAVDTSRLIETMARDVFHLVWKQAGELRVDKAATQFARSVGGERSIRAMIALARSEPGIAIDPEKLDSDGWLLNVRNGTIDLRTGELRRHDPEDLITRLCPVEYHPDAAAPVWESFLESITAGNAELVDFLRRDVGCSAVGQVVEHVLFFVHGAGANGKTTFLQAIADVLGPDFAMQAAHDLLMAKHGQQHPTEVADLHGKRFVSCIEAGEGRRLAEALVKTLTGGDKLRARRMREDFWQFDPSHTIWLAANHKPVIRGTDAGIWRRIRLVPFTVSIPADQQDKALPTKLRAEAPGILAWIVRGCLEWQRSGLSEPEAVRQATDEYREESDLLGEFIAECCVVGTPVRTRASDLYAAYLKWCERSGERPTGRRSFGEAITERGFEKTRSNGIWYSGIEAKE